ncbi:MAG TPA: GSU2403 family nucleotidyltransferase fold protein [Solirubrobacteraceae bacterium]|nr:GSU2403 family nucleotidyltransferase fold protein [Solirubrobacteraceae bacterium]
MSAAGDADLLAAARSALLDALDALAAHLDALILIGAQAVYLHTGDAVVALAEATKDSDLAVDPRELDDNPRIEQAMRQAGFRRTQQPGGWESPRGIPVDLMVPEALAGSGGQRGARIPPHDKHATRRTPGLEAAMVDNQPIEIAALDPADHRTVTIAVAGPAALIVAKLYKLGERQNQPTRLVDKDAHDIYRLLVATEAEALGRRLADLMRDDLAGPTTEAAIDWLRELFAHPAAAGSLMAGRAEELVGDPGTVAASVAALAGDVLAALDTFV